MDLERLFAASTAPSITSNVVFTNRSDELSAFTGALERNIRSRRDDPRLVEDLATPRNNVVVFYGMGGIGKSTLSNELQRRFDTGTVESADKRVSARIDFTDLSTFDPEVMLLRLRGCLGQLVGNMNAFDMAFSAYWERKHPGQPLAEFLDRRSPVATLSERVGVVEHIQTGLDAFFGGTGLVGAAWRVGSLIKDGIVGRIAKSSVLRDCPFFEPLLMEPAPDVARAFLPVLLAWDLAQFQRDNGAAVVVFLDTWEMIQAHRREPGGVEDVLSRLVYLMPNVLFVVTGRSQLTWAEDHRQTDLKYGGARCWPGLALESPHCRQYLLGSLSPEDCDRYLQQRLVRSGVPAIPPEIRARIVAGSEGLPLYLDLSAEHFDTLAARQTPQADEFGTSLPQLVTRVVRDLDGRERELLRAAALVSAFDRDLLHAAVPEYRDAVIHRFLTRHFVKTGQTGWLRHSMHDTLRASVRTHDAVSEDPWSPAEWREAATRIVGFFQQESEPDLVAGAMANRSRLVEAFLDAAELSLRYSIPADWLFRAGQVMCGMGQWHVLQRLETLARPADSLARPVVLGCLASLRREVGTLADALSLLDEALASPTLAAETNDWLCLERGQVLVRLERTAEAQVVLEPLASRPHDVGRQARAWLAVLDQRRGNFSAVMQWAAREARTDPESTRVINVLTGFVLLTNGAFARAEESFRAAVDAAVERGSPVVEALMREHLAWCVAWLDPDRGAGLAAAALDLNERIASPIGIGRSMAAYALARVGTAPPAEVLDLTARSYMIIEEAGYDGDCLHPLLVEFLLHCGSRDRVAMSAVRARIGALLARTDTQHHLEHILDWWSEHALAEPVARQSRAELTWLDVPDVVRDRWCAPLRKRWG